jgi:hypothetical protein
MDVYANPYPGVNAHLNSLLQTPGTPDQPALWHSFHSHYIPALARSLNRQLPRPRYFAISEQSLQQSELDIYGTTSRTITQPDVTVFASRSRTPHPVQTAILDVVPSLQVNLRATIEPLKEPVAIVIREVLDQRTIGRVVTRIELLSPSNKPGGSNASAYYGKRVRALEAETPLVEIDFLHESPPLVAQLAAYPGQPDAFPYTIVVSDPRPNWDEAQLRAYSFGVGEPIKLFPLPLLEEDYILCDLNPAYHDIFADVPWNTFVDYTAPPERFDTYSADDQARILAIMAQINSHTE